MPKREDSLQSIMDILSQPDLTPSLVAELKDVF